MSRTSAAEQRRLRKDLLMLRAELQRLELAGQVSDVRQAAGVQPLLRLIMPRLGSAMVAEVGERFRGAGGVLEVIGLLKRHPVLMSAGSILIGRLKKPLLRAGVVAAAAAGAVWWLGQRSERNAYPQTSGVAEADQP